VISVPFGPFRLSADAARGCCDLVTMNGALPPALALPFIAEPAKKIEKAAAAVIRVLIMLSSQFERPIFWGISPSEG